MKPANSTDTTVNQCRSPPLPTPSLVPDSAVDDGLASVVDVGLASAALTDDQYAPAELKLASVQLAGAALAVTAASSSSADSESSFMPAMHQLPVLATPSAISSGKSPSDTMAMQVSMSSGGPSEWTTRVDGVGVCMTSTTVDVVVVVTVPDTVNVNVSMLVVDEVSLLYSVVVYVDMAPGTSQNCISQPVLPGMRSTGLPAMAQHSCSSTAAYELNFGGLAGSLYVKVTPHAYPDTLRITLCTLHVESDDDLPRIPAIVIGNCLEGCS